LTAEKQQRETAEKQQRETEETRDLKDPRVDNEQREE
jgi:hypothetical protein